ncbi:MAG TPA: ABC transporter ATP-binding protein [Alphaproteobacteria bacterium]|jgi:putative ABC transport system ATP-binding protein|nr:ABC transporter ATP-binding protein [Pelagibacteraceae bacterium]MDP6784136.1 ABC transporter ATP-binding protein [Alphaproteobacteria bacterium]HJL58679.1 ABC transporter ATP-binding protein [Alphaproteobacteria bacterium]HJO14323.1 ABC transporter ATP-binding protein [Alphaproteobacteria bacterium]|tara:strand:+ start:66 stop:791 length:726 start_codon:yes stop_codon:yes gene_type:complete
MSTKKEIASLYEVVKNYGEGKVLTKALRGISVKILEGDFSVMMGPSGCGKSTLLNIIGGLDRATSGDVKFNDQDFNTLSNKALSMIRRQHIGFVFQNYNLLPVLNAYENAEYVLMLQGVAPVKRREKVMHLFKEMGLDGLENRYPRELSGGQQQRVAIARAVATEPQLVLADEITANVDSETAQSLLELMTALNKNNSTTFLFSTHDPAVIKFAKKIIILKDGMIHSEKASIEETEQFAHR